MYLEILDNLANEPSKNAKLDMLAAVKASAANDTFQQICISAFHPTTEYYIKQFDMPATYSGVRTLTEALVGITDTLATRKLTGHAARDYLVDLLSSLTEDDAEVLKRVIKHDLRCGMSESTVNKVWEDLIYSHPYMRCSGFSEKTLKNISLPCYTQLKADGLYCDVVVRTDSVTYMARSGKTIDINDPTRDALLMAAAVNGEFVIQGEVLVNDESGKLMARSASNGYINSDDKDTSRIFIMAWDCIPLNDWLTPKKVGKKSAKRCTLTYSTRLANLTKVIDQIGGVGITLVDHRVCNTVDEIADHFREVREAGEEGIIIKDFRCVWEDGTSPHMIKLKVIIEVELKIVGWYYGSEGTKNEHLVGGVNCASGDDLIAVNFGTGISDEERVAWLDTLDDMVARGQIATVKCNGVTLSKAEGAKHSLFLPRLKELRMDKSEANTLAEIQQQEAEFTNALALIGRA